MTSPDQDLERHFDDVRPRYRRAFGGGVRRVWRGGRWLLRAWRRILIAVLAVAAVALLWWLPRWMLATAVDRADECSWRIAESGEGAPGDCRQDDRLWLPQLAPWTRGDALRVEASIERQEQEDALQLAVRRDLDRDEATRAALRLVRANRSELLHGSSHDVGFRLREAGADVVLVARAAQLDSASEQALALDAAVRTGDRNSMRRIAALPAGHGPSQRFEQQRGAALCALGDRRAGLAALDRAVADADGDLEPHIAMALCAPERRVATTPRPGASALVDNARAIGGGRAELLAGTPAHRNEPAIPAMHRLTRLEGVQARDLLPFIAPSWGGPPEPVHRMQSPWSILGSPLVHPAAPGWSDSSAARLIAIADAIRAGNAGMDPDDALELRVDPHAARDQAAALRRGAMLLALDAAVGWMRRGDLARARASADTAMACARHADLSRMDPPPALLAIPLLHLVGERDAALAALDALAAGAPREDPELRAEMALQRALLLAAGGSFAGAWTALDPVMKAEVEVETRTRIAWMRAALALRTRRALDVDLPRAPDRSGFADPPERTLAYWWSAATGEPQLRRARRWRASSMGQGFEGLTSVLPAVVYVVGHAAGEREVEVWLDTITSTESIDPQAMMSARAEAARWRGDRNAAKRWEQQLAAHRELASDDRIAALFDLALW